MDQPALLIDLDNTLYDYERAASAARAAVFAELGAELGTPPATLAAAWDEAIRSVASASSGQALRQARFARVLAPYAARQAAARWTARYADAFRAATAWAPGAEVAFARLAAARRLMIVTEGYGDFADATLAALGLGTVPRHATHGTGTTKRDGSAFVAALAQLDARPERALVIGDNFTLDVQGSAACGIASLWLAHGRVAPAPPPPTLRGSVADFAAAADWVLRA